MYFISKLFKILYDLVNNSKSYLIIESTQPTTSNKKDENLNTDLQEQISENSEENKSDAELDAQIFLKILQKFFMRADVDLRKLNSQIS